MGMGARLAPIREGASRRGAAGALVAVTDAVISGASIGR